MQPGGYYYEFMLIATFLGIGFGLGYSFIHLLRKYRKS
ncbi:hypothetical protein NVIE_006530 [Nitrososphaera viennensis EN76]|uniref:Uncharacterized protein n=1 Tax=Nitrososphaera viennensis EN76 TaxID=926571 RepID=A0A060HNU1_9ARCH|nr:hypothetical protein NVIE_006530 [Nitrososphaera viennensis EN76]